MKFLLLTLSALALHLTAAGFAQTLNLNQLKITFDHSNAIYQQGEKAKFEIQYLGDLPEGSQITWSIGPEGMPATKRGTIQDAKALHTVSGGLEQPGFLNLKIQVTHEKQKIEKIVGVAFSPEKIAPSLPVPEDFDTFWADQKKKLAAIPMNSRVQHVLTLHSKGVTCFDVQLNSVDRGVSAYFAKPSESVKKSLPIILTLHGAGVRSSQMSTALLWAQRGFLAMDMSAHGLPNGKTENYYKNLADNELRDYRYRGREKREDGYFVKMFLRNLRALEFLFQQPEWDGKTVVLYGTSQGGYQAIATAYLDPRVTFLMAGVPAGCDHSGMKAQRVAGWPKLVPSNADSSPDTAVLEASRYVDNVNFAAKTKAKSAFFTAGFIDFVCPPTGVYAAFNSLPIQKKQIYNDVYRAHAPSKEAYEAMTAAIMAHVKEQKLTLDAPQKALETSQN